MALPKPSSAPCRRLRVIRLLGAAALLFAVFSHPAVNHAKDGDPKHKPAKLDRVRKQAADRGDASSQRVIVRTRRDRAAAVADRLKKHGDHVESEHRRLNSFTAVVHGDDLRALEADPDVEGLSVDAIVMADQVAGEPGQDESQVKELVRATLGLNETEYEGDKVGIAVIDSGLEKSGDLGGGRADRFFDF